MLLGAGKFVGKSIVVTALTVASVTVVIWYWRLPPDQRAAMWGTVRGGLIWLGFVAALPWALFFVPPLVTRRESNLNSALMLLGYLAADVAFALYLTGGRMGSGWQAGVLIVGFLIAGVYNFVVCEFIAARSEEPL